MLRPPLYRQSLSICGRQFSSRSRNWFGISSEYLSPRGLDIVRRVYGGLPELTTYLHSKRVFVSETSDDVRCSMFVLSQFPMQVQIRLPEFVKNAEQAAQTVLESLYSQDIDKTKTFIEQLATSECQPLLLQKPSVLIEGETKNVRLERLDVNHAALRAVEYTRERVKTDVTREWLTMQVQYDVNEHLVILPGKNRVVEDRRVLNTRFMWTFETEVTTPEKLDWALVHATPFQEKQAVVTK